MMISNIAVQLKGLFSRWGGNELVLHKIRAKLSALWIPPLKTAFFSRAKPPFHVGYAFLRIFKESILTQSQSQCILEYRKSHKMSKNDNSPFSFLISSSPLVNVLGVRVIRVFNQRGQALRIPVIHIFHFPPDKFIC